MLQRNAITYSSYLKLDEHTVLICSK